MNTEPKAAVLDMVQKENRLNDVLRIGDVGPGGGYHHYQVVKTGTSNVVGEIKYQCGPRADENSVSGVLDCDLLEMVKDRLTCFQAGPFACDENANALKAVEEALYWMNKRVEDRAKRGVLGHNKE